MSLGEDDFGVLRGPRIWHRKHQTSWEDSWRYRVWYTKPEDVAIMKKYEQQSKAKRRKASHDALIANRETFPSKIRRHIKQTDLKHRSHFRQPVVERDELSKLLYVVSSLMDKMIKVEIGHSYSGIGPIPPRSKGIHPPPSAGCRSLTSSHYNAGQPPPSPSANAAGTRSGTPFYHALPPHPPDLNPDKNVQNQTNRHHQQTTPATTPQVHRLPISTSPVPNTTTTRTPAPILTAPPPSSPPHPRPTLHEPTPNPRRSHPNKTTPRHHTTSAPAARQIEPRRREP